MFQAYNQAQSYSSKLFVANKNYCEAQQMLQNFSSCFKQSLNFKAYKKFKGSDYLTKIKKKENNLVDLYITVIKFLRKLPSEGVHLF